MSLDKKNYFNSAVVLMSRFHSWSTLSAVVICNDWHRFGSVFVCFIHLRAYSSHVRLVLNADSNKIISGTFWLNQIDVMFENSLVITDSDLRLYLGLHFVR